MTQYKITNLDTNEEVYIAQNGTQLEIKLEACKKFPNALKIRVETVGSKLWFSFKPQLWSRWKLFKRNYQ